MFQQLFNLLLSSTRSSYYKPMCGARTFAYTTYTYIAKAKKNIILNFKN